MSIRANYIIEGPQIFVSNKLDSGMKPEPLGRLMQRE
jgi:hypothetical protein